MPYFNLYPPRQPPQEKRDSIHVFIWRVLDDSGNNRQSVKSSIIPQNEKHLVKKTCYTVRSQTVDMKSALFLKRSQSECNELVIPKYEVPESLQFHPITFTKIVTENRQTICFHVSDNLIDRRDLCLASGIPIQDVFTCNYKWDFDNNKTQEEAKSNSISLEIPLKINIGQCSDDATFKISIPTCFQTPLIPNGNPAVDMTTSNKLMVKGFVLSGVPPNEEYNKYITEARNLKAKKAIQTRKYKRQEEMRKLVTEKYDKSNFAFVEGTSGGYCFEPKRNMEKTEGESNKTLGTCNDPCTDDTRKESYPLIKVRVEGEEGTLFVL